MNVFILDRSMEKSAQTPRDTNSCVSEFAHRFSFPGWYIDITGCYSCLLGKYLISIFMNDCDNTLDITVDTISDTGHFDQNIEWETPENDDELAKTARRFMVKYAAKI